MKLKFKIQESEYGRRKLEFFPAVEITEFSLWEERDLDFAAEF